MAKKLRFNIEVFVDVPGGEVHEFTRIDKLVKTAEYHVINRLAYIYEINTDIVRDGSIVSTCESDEGKVRSKTTLEIVEDSNRGDPKFKVHATIDPVCENVVIDTNYNSNSGVIDAKES